MPYPSVRSLCPAGGAMLLGAVLLAGAALPAFAADPDSRRMEKQIRLFERAVDEMLIDSPNFLVRDRENTRGTYIEGRGVRFTFRTDLNLNRWDDDGGFWHVLHEKGHKFLVFGDDEWIELEARLRGADYFHEKDLRKLTLRVRMSDLRAYSSGRLNMDEITDRMEIKES